MEQQLQFYLQNNLFSASIQSNIEKFLSDKWMEWEKQPVDQEFVEYIIVRDLLLS